MPAEVLVIPQWQGYAASDAPAQGARAIAAQLAPAAHAVDVRDWYAVPNAASGGAHGGRVLGLADIAGHVDAALTWLAAAAPAKLLAIGGDCGADFAPIAWQAERHTRALGVLYLDAHADLNTPASSPSGRFHGMVLRTLLGQGPPELLARCTRALSPDQLVLAGTRDLDPPERAFLASAGLATWPAASIADGRLAAAVRAHSASVWHVHFDLDVLDPADFPDVTVPTPGGVPLAAVAALLAELTAACNVVSVSVTEHIGGAASAARIADALTQLGWLAA